MRISIAHGIVGVLTLTTAAVAAQGDTPSTDTYRQLRVLTEALHIVHDEYVEPRAMDALVGDATRGLLGAVDADASFQTPTDRHHLADEASHDRGDVGLVLTRQHGVVNVVTALPESPAARAGLRSGDLVLGVDGTATDKLQLWEVLDRIGGAPGTQVTLRVLREGWPAPREIVAAREEPHGPAVQADDLGDGFVRLRVHRIHPGMAGEIDAALTHRPAPLTGVVLDVRDVAGAAGEVAAELGGPFLEDGEVVAIAAARDDAPQKRFLAHAARRWRDVPLVVLVDHGTAGAAEVVTGALQDSHRAVVVGARTFGLARERTRLQLGDGSVLRIATARDLTPQRHRVDGSGITPDIVVTSGSSDHGATDDVPLQRAIEILKAARVVERQGRAG